LADFVSRVAHRGVNHEPASPTVELVDVSVVYAGKNGMPEKALAGITCRITAGERVAVVGPNGAGKSTLFKLIAGMLKPSEGRIDIYGHGPAGHICIGYVPQAQQIDRNFPVNVEDVVMMGRIGQIGLFRWPRKQDWRHVRRSLEAVDAVHLARKQIGELSGGQQQRVFIARALAQEAEILLLDEPLSGLDIPSQEKIVAILDRLRDQSVTVLVATHDLNLATEHFDRVLLLNRSMVAFEQPELALSPRNLLQAYGAQLHQLGDEVGVILTDACCEP
jgi:manganese/iron transport system ATP-binding protein